MKRIAVIGSISSDLVFQLPEPSLSHSKVRAISKHRCLGGSAAITAAWLGRFGHSVHLFGTVGDDSDGTWCLEQLSKCPNLDISGVEISRGATGTAVSLVCGEDKRIVTFKGPENRRDFNLPDKLGFQHLHFVHPDHDLKFEAKLKDALEQNPAMTVSIELNGRTGSPYLKLANIAFTNSDEAQRTFGAPVEEFKESILSNMSDRSAVFVVTRGREGAIAYAGGASWAQAPMDKVEVVDRTGAGDAFNAGYLSSSINSHPIEFNLDEGLISAGECLNGIGGIPWLS